MRAGSLHQVIVIQQRSTTEDTEWGNEVAWTDYLTRRADVNPLTANELMRNQGPSSEATYLIRMRYEKSLTDQHRITWKNKVFDIVGVINVDELDEETHVMARVTDQS